MSNGNKNLQFLLRLNFDPNTLGGYVLIEELYNWNAVFRLIFFSD